MNHTIVAYGEILWDLLPSGAVIGGAPFNFAYRAKTLGNQVCMVSRLGRDELGEKAMQRVIELGMDTRYIQRDDTYPTGTVDVFFDENKNPDYNINKHVAYDHIQLTDDLIELIQGVDCLCFGSLIQREETSKNTLYTLIDYFKGPYILFDINLRKDCYSRETISRSLEKANICKLNEEETAMLDTMLGLDQSDIPGRAKKLLSQFDLYCCLVTLGEKGSYVVAENGEEAYVPGYSVELVDPVGAGDGCTAGFVDQLLSGSSIRDAAHFGNGVGAVVATQEGAIQVTTHQQIESFIAQGQYSETHPEFQGFP
jgi:fructokinase